MNSFRQDIPNVPWNPNIHLRVTRGPPSFPPLDGDLNQTNALHILAPYRLNYSAILSFHVSWDCPSGSFYSGCETQCLTVVFVSHYMPRPYLRHSTVWLCFTSVPGKPTAHVYANLRPRRPYVRSVWCYQPKQGALSVWTPWRRVGTGWRWVVSFASRPLYPWSKCPQYPLNRRLCGFQGQSEGFGEEKKPVFPAGNWATIAWWPIS